MTESRALPGAPLLAFDSFAAEIASLDYRAVRRFIRVRINPPLSRFIYKYRAVRSDEASIARLREIVVESKLWLSSPIDFNDPFEMAALFIAKGTLAEKQERFNNLAKGQGLRWKERKKAVREMMTRKNEEFARIANDSHGRQMAKVGVISFGGDARSMLMWSHYAQDHTGICLQFERAKDPYAFLRALPMEYSDDYPVINWIDERAFRERMGTILLQKHIGWQYENEHRIAIPNGAHRHLEFKPEALTGIIVGCRASDETVQSVKQLLQERLARGLPDPKLYRAVQHESKYRLRLYSMSEDEER